MPDDTRVRELLDELLDQDSTPEEICVRCPELLPVVRTRWRQICRARAELDVMLLVPPHEADTLQMDERLPQVPGYEVESVLGQGGMGIVFRARQVKLSRLVALKMTLAGSYASEQERERFRREAETVAALRHANVVQIFDVGDLAGRPYFTMELIEGGSLAQRQVGAQPPRWWQLWRKVCTRPTREESSIATSSPPTFCSRLRARRKLPTSASLGESQVAPN